MTSDEIEEFFIRRLERVLLEQAKLILQDTHLTEQAKDRQLILVAELMTSLKENQAKMSYRKVR